MRYLNTVHEGNTLKKLIPLVMLLGLAACKPMETKYDEWCLNGVTYYHFDKGDQSYAVSPKYDTEGKIVTCEQTSNTQSE